MEDKHFYVYCNGILGVKTNIKNFKWVYGSVAPETNLEEYKKCAVKFDVCLKPEKKFSKLDCFDESFQSYKWNNLEKTISFRRCFLKKIKIGYNVKIEGNTVFAEIGENYYKFVKNRIMNLHGIYYLLSDIANIMLLKNGYATLYSAAVYYSQKNKGIVFFAPPNTGKTVTATKLCELSKCSLVGEDIIITDGEKIFSCPWTSSYRKENISSGDGGSFGRTDKVGNWKICESCKITDMVILSLGKKGKEIDNNNFIRKAKILNGYLFNYFSSPIIKLLGYFDETYDKQWKDVFEKILAKLIDSAMCIEIVAEKPTDFQKFVKREILGENL